MTKTDRAALLQGTLDMLVLKALQPGSRHGYDIARWIQSASKEALAIEEGSLYPALHRMERRGWIVAEWGLSESNRKAKFYKLTRTGRAQLTKQLHSWDTLVRAIALVINSQQAEV